MLKTKMRRRALCAGFCATVLLLPTGAPGAEVQAGKEAGRQVDLAQAVVGGQPTAEKSNLPLGIEFVPIPGGEFEMGSIDGEADEQPVHRVRISAFKMSKTEVTQAQWRAVMGSSPSHFPAATTARWNRSPGESCRSFSRKRPR
jgi:formylglycine-generating enzyme required for sulfatase activity